MPQQMMLTIQRIKQNLTPDLLRRPPTREHPLAGHCYVASEAFYTLHGKELGFRPKRAKDASGENHYWLEAPTGEVLDLTAEQYTDFGETPPYADGKFCAFITPTPCLRTRCLIANMNHRPMK